MSVCVGGRVFFDLGEGPCRNFKLKMIMKEVKKSKFQLNSAENKSTKKNMWKYVYLKYMPHN